MQLLQARGAHASGRCTLSAESSAEVATGHRRLLSDHILSRGMQCGVSGLHDVHAVLPPVISSMES
jgi:hypothetical protein